MNRERFLNTSIDNVTLRESLNIVDGFIRSDKPHYVVTPNVDHIVKLEQDTEFKKVYDDADLILTDGMPLIWISKLLKKPIKEKISGSDFFPAVCKLADEKGYSIFLLGAAEGVAKKAAENIQNMYPNIAKINYYSPSFGFESNRDETDNIVEMIRKEQPDILAVGVGAPKQEKFIYNNYKEIGVPVTLAIGATIDFLAGNVKRAPKWMQKSGLEWFYRLGKEPKRMFKRYLIDDLKIIKIVFKYKGKY